jgi:toxin ParE1/3/4
MKPLEFSEKSLADLSGILAYIARDKPLAARRFVDELEQQCEFLARFPPLGSQREDLAPQLRLMTHHGYGVYYRDLPEKIRIERVLHPSLDVGGQAF